jgi:hypothetical protein
MNGVESRGRVVGLVFGAMAAEVLFTAARLGVADRLGDNERTGPEVAAELGADSTSVTRLLRAMAALELLEENNSGRFRLTEAGALLRTDRPDSMTSFVEMFGDPTMLAAWRELEHAVRTGETTFDRVYSNSFFGYLADHPQMSARFNAAMRQGTALTASQLPDAYDFSRFRTVADIGGGDGTLPAAVLSGHPHLNGILSMSVGGNAPGRISRNCAPTPDFG